MAVAVGRAVPVGYTVAVDRALPVERAVPIHLRRPVPVRREDAVRRVDALGCKDTGVRSLALTRGRGETHIRTGREDFVDAEHAVVHVRDGLRVVVDLVLLGYTHVASVGIRLYPAMIAYTHE